MASDKPYCCEVCTASCTFEAMQWCQHGIDPSVDSCPVEEGLASGRTVDWRPTDADPNFPSEFSYAND